MGYASYVCRLQCCVFARASGVSSLVLLTGEGEARERGGACRLASCVYAHMCTLTCITPLFVLCRYVSSLGTVFERQPNDATKYRSAPDPNNKNQYKYEWRSTSSGAWELCQTSYPDNHEDCTGLGAGCPFADYDPVENCFGQANSKQLLNSRPTSPFKQDVATSYQYGAKGSYTSEAIRHMANNGVMFYGQPTWYVFRTTFHEFAVRLGQPPSPFVCMAKPCA